MQWTKTGSDGFHFANAHICDSETATWRQTFIDKIQVGSQV
jgi:hypothetical protein